MIRDSVPDKLVAGDTWRWLRAFADYPAPTWTVTYYFENQFKQFSQAAIASGTSQAVTISAATSGPIQPGRYRWYARATDGSVIETIEDENGWLEVVADPGAAGTRDARSWARRTLDAVEAQIEGRATDGQKMMTIGARTLERIPIPELLTLRDRIRQEVRSEEQAERAGVGRKLQLRIGRG